MHLKGTPCWLSTYTNMRNSPARKHLHELQKRVCDLNSRTSESNALQITENGNNDPFWGAALRPILVRRHHEGAAGTDSPSRVPDVSFPAAKDYLPTHPVAPSRVPADSGVGNRCP